jgi:hypothetical protein
MLDAIERRPAIAVPVLQHISSNPADHCERSGSDKDPRPDVHLGSVSDCSLNGLTRAEQSAPSSAVPGRPTIVMFGQVLDGVQVRRPGPGRPATSMRTRAGRRRYDPQDQRGKTHNGHTEMYLRPPGASSRAYKSST